MENSRHCNTEELTPAPTPVGYGVLSYNLHVIGRELLARERARSETVRAAA